MHRVRTDLHALFIGLLLVSALTYFASGYGILPRPGVKTLDASLLWCLIGGLIYLAVLIPGHLLFRHVGIAGRWAYAGLGAAACTAALVSRMALSEVAAGGMLSLHLLFTVVSGALFGFLYHWRAGYEALGDDPARLARTLNPGMGPAGDPVMALRTRAAASGGTFGQRAPSLSPDRALVDTGDEEYFDGPLQVRTSVPLAFVAAFMATCLFGLGKYLFTLGLKGATIAPKGLGPLSDQMSAVAGFEGAALLCTVVLGTLPVAVLILVAHAALRGMDKRSYAAYAVGGLIAPVVIGLLMFVVFVFMGLLLAVPTAIAMLVYRNMAGLEPKPVKEDVIVGDRRNLVGADHERRRYGRVVKAG